MKVPNNRKLFAVAFCLLAVIVSGCGNGDDVSLVAVKGVVTLDGQPVPDARVIFHPAEGGRPSNAVTESDGSYELLYMEGQMGALPGRHKVSISTFVEADPDSTDSLTQAGQKEIIPASYNTQSTLEAEVDSGSEVEQNFDLKSSAQKS